MRNKVAKRLRKEAKAVALKRYPSMTTNQQIARYQLDASIEYNKLKKLYRAKLIRINWKLKTVERV